MTAPGPLSCLPPGARPVTSGILRDRRLPRIFPIRSATRADRKQASRDDRAACRVSQRPGDQFGRGADLPDDQLPVPRHRARRQSVRAQGARQHLYPHHEPDQRGARGAGRRARRRGRGAGARLGAGGLDVLRQQHRAGRRQFRQLDRSLRRHLEPVPAHDAAHDGDRGALCRSERPREFPPRHRRANPLLLRRDPAEPEARSLSDRRGRQDRPRAGGAADRRQHGRAGAVPAARARRRGRHALDDEIYRRARHLDRRHRRRWRQFRLGEARRPLPAVEPAGPGLSRRGVDAGGQAAGADRLHPQDARHLAARPRRRGEPVQLVPAHPGAGDAGAADAGALRQCGRRWRTS